MKNCLKKSLAFLLAFMMVFSYIAYVEPIEADARATINTYRHADQYGTPVWDGSNTYYSTWNSGSSYTTFTWPKHIYMDVSETLESAGYYYTVEWDYGNGTDYRIVNNGFIFGGWQYWSNGWKNASDKYTTSNTSSNWTTDCYEGTWKEVRFEITIYDKSGLNYAKQKSDTVLTSITPYLSYNTAGYDNFIAQRNATANTLKTREVTQAGLTTQITTLSDAANALRFAASNSNLMTAISNARSKMAEADYSKYTEASRNALATALSNAKASSYDDGIAT